MPHSLLVLDGGNVLLVQVRIVLGSLGDFLFEDILDIIVFIAVLVFIALQMNVRLQETSADPLTEEVLANGALVLDVSDAQIAVVRGWLVYWTRICWGHWPGMKRLRHLTNGR